ncbi:reverse transcriptase [Lasius niger]|uniref:Reverse transcriptase n=1 Tax=Lasius niger TaxID=67767 RepID=A0A0J7N324_LASNI|nr:reverse transcriptase [Lasius niger]
MLDEVRHAADRRMVTVFVFFDFSKAFDRVDYFLLIVKLKSLNFSDSVLRWIYSYLRGRTQAVKDNFEGTISSLSVVNAGVPQGSVLGPLLFTLYIADFGRKLRHCKYNFYADDLQIYTHCEPRDLVDTIRKVNKDIESVLGWSTANRLILNSDQTQAIIMGTSRFINAIDLSTQPEIRVDGSRIQYSTSIKYLGVTIMNTLSWEKQVTNMSNRIHSVLYQLKLCKHLFPEALESRLKHTHPPTHYCCAAYTDMTAEHNLKLYRAMNCCIRFIFNVKADVHITPYYERLGWLKIVARRAYFVGCLL